MSQELTKGTNLIERENEVVAIYNIVIMTIMRILFLFHNYEKQNQDK